MHTLTYQKLTMLSAKVKNDVIFKLQQDFLVKPQISYQNYRNREGIFGTNNFQKVNSKAKFWDHLDFMCV